MTDNSQRSFMICPCCGQNREIKSLTCGACGARQVGQPLTPPDVLLPKFGLPLGALTCAILIIVAFLSYWIFANVMRVARALLVWVIDDSLDLKQTLLKGDPKLLSYRIFSFDAFKAAFYISFGAIPISMLGMWLASRAKRLADLTPARYGGFGLARNSFALTTCLFLGFSTVAISSIPDVLARGRARRIAATQAMMYEMHANALQKYYQEYGIYPGEMTDLLKVNADASPRLDYWEHSLVYEPVGEIASNGSSYPFTNSKLISAGPDRKLHTADDIIMIDGLLVDQDPDHELLTTQETPRP